VGPEGKQPPNRRRDIRLTNHLGPHHKQLICRDAGGGCDEVIRAATEEQVLHLVLDHVCFAHTRCETSPDEEASIRPLITEVWGWEH
jgi:predicted small metal-binding protein